MRPDVCPQPTAGATVRLVCAFSSPLLGAGFTVGWCGPSGLLAHCQACGIRLGIWCISWGGSARCTGVGGAGSARFSFGEPLWEGPCGTRRESDLPEGWIRRSTALGVCAVQASSVASKFHGRNWFPLGFWLGDGRGRWLFPTPLFPAKLSSVVQGSRTLPPVVLQPPRSLSRAVNL